MSEQNTELLDAQESQDDYESNPSHEEGEGQETDDGLSDTQSQLDKVIKERDEARRDKNGLLDKIKILEKKSKSSPQATTSSLDLERLDKLELRMLDKDLSAEQVTDILLLKNAKGLADVSEAYNHPMIQTWLQQTRSDKAKDDSIKKATPKAQRSVAPSGETKKGVELSKSKNWVEKLPSDNLDAVAQALTENFFADDK